jgi:hypothetical protein
MMDRLALLFISALSRFGGFLAFGGWLPPTSAGIVPVSRRRFKEADRQRFNQEPERETIRERS